MMIWEVEVEDDAEEDRAKEEVVEGRQGGQGDREGLLPIRMTTTKTTTIMVGVALEEIEEE